MTDQQLPYNCIIVRGTTGGKGHKKIKHEASVKAHITAALKRDHARLLGDTYPHEFLRNGAEVLELKDPYQHAEAVSGTSPLSMLLKTSPSTFTFSPAISVTTDNAEILAFMKLAMDYESDNYDSWRFTVRAFKESGVLPGTITKTNLPSLIAHVGKPFDRKKGLPGPRCRDLWVEVGHDRCFISIVNHEAIGQVNYYARTKAVEIERKEKKLDAFVIKMDEVWLKGANKTVFVNAVMSNMLKKYRPYIKEITLHGACMVLVPNKTVARLPERSKYVLHPSPNGGNGDRKNLSEEEIWAVVRKGLETTPGVSAFQEMTKVYASSEVIIAHAVETFKQSNPGPEERVFITVKGQVFDKKLRDKLKVALNTVTKVRCLNVMTGAKMRRVKVKHRMLTVDTLRHLSFVSWKHPLRGIGGIPVVYGRKQDHRNVVVSLLSGGFDSPVAAFHMMKRGCQVILVHCQNVNAFTEDSVKDKIERLARQLATFQVTTHLFVVPFKDLQQEIIMKVPARSRMLVYKSFMLRLASHIAQKMQAKMLVVGDSMGQVASQTTTNIEAIYTQAPVPILAPLMGMNKDEIITTSRQIGTYDVSSLPYGDCCSYFLAKHPDTEMKGDVLSKYIDMIDPNIELTAVDQAYHAILYGKYDLHVQKPGHSEALSVLDATEGSCILEQWSAEAAEAQKNSALVAKRKANLITVTPPGTPHPASDAMDTAEDATTVAVDRKKPVQQTLSIYLDNAATTRVDDTVAHAMTEYLLAPLSLTRNKNIIQEARETVASAISANPTDILFTSGGTESNNWAIQGAIMQAKAEASGPRRYHLVTTSVEHEAVLAVMHHLVEYYDDVDLTILPVDFQGVLLEDTLRKLLDKRSQDTVLVSVMHANNEVGTVQNIHALATVCKSYNTGILFHTDACQSIGKVPAIVGDNIDLMTLNAHKLHGPKGVGALYVRDQSTISPLFAGRADGQEEGELNTVGILGFSVAIATNCNLTDSKRVSPQIAEVSRIRNLLFKTLQTVFPAAYVHGPALPENDTDISTLSFINRLPNNISVCFGDIKPTAEEVVEFQVKPDKTIKYEGEQAVTFLSSQGVSCSTASACSSNRTDQFNKISHVLKALKLSRAQAIGSLRFSTSKYTKESDVTTDLLPVLQAFRRSLLVSLSS